MIISLRLYALIAGTVVVGLAARYGWISADASTDKAITAVMLATVALAGLCGHAVAVRVARASWSAGALVAMVSIAAVLVSLGTSIGSIATRGDALAAERGRLASTGEAVRNELIRLNVERTAIKAVSDPGESAIAAATAAVAASYDVRKAECDRRGPNCRQRETAETERRADLLALQDRAAIAAHAARIDSRIEDLRSRADAMPLIVAINPQARAISTVIRVNESDVMTWQAVAIAVVLELTVLAALIASEVLSHELAAPNVTDTAPTTLVADVEQRNDIEEADTLPLPPPTAAMVPQPELNLEISFQDLMARVFNLTQTPTITADAVLAVYRRECQSLGLEPPAVAEWMEQLRLWCIANGCKVRPHDGSIKLALSVKTGKALRVA